MPLTRKAVRSSKRIVRSDIEESLNRTLEREFEDYTATRTRPEPDNARGRERYLASRRRMALASPHVGIGAFAETPGHDERQGAVGYVMDLQKILKSGISLNSALNPIRLGEGLYDFYPPDLPPQGFVRNRRPFTNNYSLPKSDPANGSLLLSIPQFGTGRFYASASSLSLPVDRFARAWAGTVVPIDANLHTNEPKDVIVWAEGTMSYDYELTAPVGPAWNSQPAAAKASVNVMVRLLRYSRQTGQLLADPDAILSYLAHRTLVDATLLPNGVTTQPPSAIKPSVGGPYAAWSSGVTNFAMDYRDGKTRKLETDSTYQVAVLCSVSIEARAAGQGGGAVASAEASAQLFLRVVTLGIVPHDPKVTF